MLYYFKARLSTFLNCNTDFNFNFKMLNTFLYQLQAMYICYPTIYDMAMLALVSYMNILIEWKYSVYPDSILNQGAFTMIYKYTRIPLCFKLSPIKH
jgi:hypothetical protein